MLTFPDEEMLRFWISSIKQHPKAFREVSDYLPLTNRYWVSRMASVFSRVEYKYHANQAIKDISGATADVFYNIIKLHAEIDGNKRSALICIYLFIIVNLINTSHNYNNDAFSKKGAFKMYKMAKRIAKSKGNRYEKTHKKRLAKEFKELLN